MSSRKNHLLAVASAAIFVAACSSSPASSSPKDGSAPDAPADSVVTQSSTVSVGPAGGTVSVAGASVVIPADALSSPTSITVAVATDAPPLPSNLTPLGSIFAFTPHGQPFSSPVMISVPFTAPATGTPQLYVASPDSNGWLGPLTEATTGDGVLSLQVVHFSWFVVVLPGQSGCRKIGQSCQLEGVGPCCANADWGVECSLSTLHLCVVQILGPCTSSTDCYGNDQNPPEAICNLGTCCALAGFGCGQDKHCCSGTCSAGICL